MRGRRILIALALLISFALIGTMAITPAQAQAPAIWTANASNVKKEVFDRVASAATVDVYIKIANVSHLTHEDDLDPRYGGCAPTDLTWSYQLYVTWDDTVLMLDTSRIWEPREWFTPLGSAPDNLATHMSFLKWAYWAWDVDLEAWTATNYGTLYSAGFEPGVTNKIGLAMSLTAQDPGKPWNFFALPTDTGWQDEGAHAGTYYDLPYSRLNKNDLLVRLRFKNLDTGGTGGTKWSRIRIEGLLKTIGQQDVVLPTYDAWYGAKMEPEFPLGLAPVIMLAPMIPILYVWRMRKKRVR